MRKVVGLHAAREVLNVRPKSVREVILRKDFGSSQDLRPFADFAKSRKVRLTPQSTGFLEKIAFSNQGVCLVVDEAPEMDWDSLKSEGPQRILALDGISDPHNLGAILRTSWLLGATALVVPEARAAGLTPAACKVASGGAEHVPVVAVSNLANELKALKELGFWVYGLDGDAKSTVWDFDLPEKVVWVVGSEDKGMRTPVKRVCDDVGSIPIASNGASFNASVAASMALYETSRQHSKLLK